MKELNIIEITEYCEGGINKTKMVIIENNEEKEIIFEGSGEIKSAVEA